MNLKEKGRENWKQELRIELYCIWEKDGRTMYVQYKELANYLGGGMKELE